MILRRAAARLLALIRGRRLDRELEDEIRAHLELAERDAIAAGIPPEEAHRTARRRFGPVEQVREEHRERRSIRWIETLLRDACHGLAALVRDPGFAAVAIGVLALGIGATVAMFSVVDASLFKPLPFPDPDRIVRVWEAPRPGSTNATSTLDFLDWKRLGSFFEALAAEDSVSAALTGQGEARRLAGKTVTADYFRVFAANPQLGRTFRPEEDQPGTAPVVVLSYAAWQTYFGGDPGVLNRQLVLDGQSHQVVGVLPPGAFDRDAEFWKPLIFTPEQRTRDYHWLTVHGRLRSGTTLAQVNEQMRAIHAALADVTPIFKREWTIVVESLDRVLVGDRLRRSLSIAFGAVVMVLLIACANVVNLVLARSAARRKEMAIRAALGAGRGRLVAQLLTESLVLCLLGGTAGIALAFLLVRAATAFLSRSLPFTAAVQLDLRALGFAAAMVLGATLLVGALPAVGNLSRSLSRSARGSTGGHAGVRRMIVTSEVALSLVLVCGGLLLLRSLAKLQRLETGIQVENVITMSVNLPLGTYPTPQRAALFYESLAERLNATPGIAGAAATTHLPLEWIGDGEGLWVAGIDEAVNVRFKRIDPGYFSTLGISLLAGRGIAGRDRAGAPRVVVINQALAARLEEVAGMKAPVGRRIRLGCPHYIEKGILKADVEIVGIIRGERVAPPGRPDPPVAYVPLAQVPRPEIKLLVRTKLEPESAMPAVREALRQVDPNLPLGDIVTMQQVRERTLSGTSRPAWLIGAFAAVAALLAALGLYGVLAHAVTQQRREIGIRMALGASRGDVVSRVLRNALSMIFVGLALGAAGVFALTRLMRNLLFQVSPLDPVSLVAACTSMLAVGLLAGWIPARNAARVDPVTTLREEG